jgi:tRNA dimethylallyltransferase
MLYFKALREGLDPLPSADATLRAALEARATEIGWPAMHQELARLDPAMAARLTPNDSQRIQRALEVCMVSGQPMSTLLTRTATQRAREHAQGNNEGNTHRYITLSLEPSDRSALHDRIARRFDLMLEQGLVDEVRRLQTRSDLHTGLPAVRCVGYRQIWSYLDGEIDLDVARASSIAATRQLAKRQLTWLRAQPTRIIIDCLASDAAERVGKVCAQFPPHVE